ncbi:aminoacyl-tRNA hydrolase [candidate division WWE3 bacterium RIFOXYC1_FULL_39_7]|uniref:Peptidyl-tRNA hydrolase n=1 Tax=candidate division WWE3 bacterium RIFOXYC1_FULL_39_7 TaxID=1802643 RepID=A0A1F4WGW2_UNCKA|nr:MAG: aminoacyl-tRNA hydrolase [candidate division WWE3 bacterium RIFOXYC1_FULL_39_7]
MRLIIGLGNPGLRYANTRHNLGSTFVDYFAESKSLVFSFQARHETYLAQNTSLMIAKPVNFMNNSGSTVRSLVNFYKIDLDDLFIVHDDLDLTLGDFKIQKGTGPKDHNGVNSVESSLGSIDFWRIRIGADNRTPDNQISGEEYVLMPFSEFELTVVKNLLPTIAKRLNENIPA